MKTTMERVNKTSSCQTFLVQIVLFLICRVSTSPVGGSQGPTVQHERAVPDE